MATQSLDSLAAAMKQVYHGQVWAADDAEVYTSRVWEPPAPASALPRGALVAAAAVALVAANPASSRRRFLGGLLAGLGGALA